MRQLLKEGQITLEDIVSGGDDYEILCTIEKETHHQAERIAKALDVKFTAIGEVVKGEDAVLMDADSNIIKLNKRGFIHH